MPTIGKEIDKDNNKTATDGIVVDAQTIEKEEKKMTGKGKSPVIKAESEKIQLIRPPMEQLTRDFEDTLADVEIDGKKLEKLGYKCGKIIYGIKQENQKDFRCIAFKARKKSKSVNGKSRCIFYFGINQASAKTLVKANPELHISKFGKCSVQSQSPVELILDRTTYTEKFDKNLDKVNALMETLVSATIESKTEQLAELNAKILAKEEKKAKKKAKAEADTAKEEAAKEKPVETAEKAK